MSRNTRGLKNAMRKQTLVSQYASRMEYDQKDVEHVLYKLQVAGFIENDDVFIKLNFNRLYGLLYYTTMHSQTEINMIVKSLWLGKEKTLEALGYKDLSSSQVNEVDSIINETMLIQINNE